MLRLREERSRTDELLNLILHEAAVAQMKQGFLVADEFENVFILATDICGFTKMAAASDPGDVLRILSELFSSFDACARAAVPHRTAPAVAAWRPGASPGV
eukprot:1861754-Prymnesium_polylepis.1